MNTFAELAASRRAWIQDILRPWCVGANRHELRLAELEWVDLAGKPDPKATLWTWAWSRFPELVHEGLPGVNETHEVVVTLKDGEAHRGYPDNRETEHGLLVLLDPVSEAWLGPFSIDDILSVTRVI